MYPFHANVSIVVNGTSGAGKSTWVSKLISEKDWMFQIPPTRVLYCYGIYQSLYKEMEQSLSFVEFHQGLPNVDEIDGLPENSLVVLDDLAGRMMANKEIEELFSMQVHHKKLNVIFLNHNLFIQGKCSKTIANNTHVYVFLKNPRGLSQLTCLARQVFPGKSKALVEAYEDCMRKRYGYLVLDLSPYGDQEHMLRTDIFKDDVTVVYKIL